MRSARRKVEDTAQGCRSLAEDDRARARALINPQMRAALERSADAWTARANLLDHLQASFNERIAANRPSSVRAQ